MSVTTSITTGRSAFSACASAPAISEGFSTDAHRTHVFGEPREIHLVEGPERAPPLGLLAADTRSKPRFDWLPPPLLLTTVIALIFQRTAVSTSARCDTRSRRRP
jgi:hypothetical protein